MSQFAGVFPVEARDKLGWLLEAVWMTRSLKKAHWAKYLVQTRGWTAQGVYKRIARTLKTINIKRLMSFEPGPNPALVVEAQWVKRPRTPRTTFTAKPSSDRARGFWVLWFLEFSKDGLQSVGTKVIPGDGQLTGSLPTLAKAGKPTYVFWRRSIPYIVWYKRFESYSKILTVLETSSGDLLPKGFERVSIPRQTKAQFAVTNDKYRAYFEKGFRDLEQYDAVIEQLFNHFDLKTLQSRTVNSAETVLNLALLAWWGFGKGALEVGGNDKRVASQTVLKKPSARLEGVKK